MIIVASATKFDGYYKLKLDDLAAVKWKDLTCVSMLQILPAVTSCCKKADAARQYSMMNSKLPVLEQASAPHIFPNPVTNNTFSVLFDDMKDGRYSIVVTDLAGRILQTKSVSVAKGAQAERINLNPRSAKGVYMVKVLNENKKR